MKIERQVLVKYKRFRLRKIDRLDYRPSVKTQVILGSNGSGKSSLIEELSPLPANSKDFLPGGSKEVWISHRGDKYYLASLFTDEGTRFLFELNGENLNHGLTVTGYRELVKQHFNYTKEIHNVLTGKTCFHAMSVNDRRNWFMALSDVDYDYAVKYYKRLKDRQRDLTGALKRTQERHTDELNKQLTETKEKELRILADESRAYLSHLLNCKPGIDGDQDHGRQLSEIEAQVSFTLGQLQDMLSRQTGTPQTEPDMVTEQQRLSDRLVSLNQEIKLRYEATLQLQNKLAEFKGTHGHTLESLQGQLTILEPKYQQARLGLSFTFDASIENPEMVLSVLDTSQDYLLGLAASLSELPREHYDRDAYITAQEALTSALLTQQRLQQQLLAIDAKLKEAEQKKTETETECPSCQYKWIINYSAREHAELTQLKEKLVVEMTQHDTTTQQRKLKLDTIRTTIELTEQWLRFTRGYSGLSPVWHILEERGVLTDHPEQMGSLLNALRIHFSNAILVSQMEKEIAECYRMKQILEAINQSDKEGLEKRLVEEDAIILDLQRKMKAAQETYELITRDLDLRRTIQVTYQKLLDYHQTRTTLTGKLVVDQIRKAMDEAIYTARMQLSEMERRLTQIDIHRGLIMSLEKEINQLKQDARLLSLAVDELSPATGLIAKGMTSFINSFIDDVNLFINRIWLYPLELAHVELNDDDECDLDYKFEIKVNGERVSGDVNETSAGMKEIINLAFVIVSMQYLKLEDFPIFLDEFAVKMDSAHRTAAYQIIDYLTDSNEFSQVFLISHYENGYSNLSDAEILVLCSSNVVLPKHLTYNAHVEMT